MNAAVIDSHSAQDYVVADIALAGWGRKELNIAETEMPGSCRSATNTRRSSR